MNFIKGMKFKKRSLGIVNELHQGNEVQKEVVGI
ncbi:hypothetical protein JOD29_001640 [Lysinibacillus composti]|nr:hypothetical protein [Lysinibacillus composti]